MKIHWDRIFNYDTLYEYIVKAIRLLITFLILKLTKTNFKDQYIRALKNKEKIPSLYKFINKFIILEIVMNSVFTISLPITSLSSDFIIASTVDYIVGTAISYKLALATVYLINKKDSLNYEKDQIMGMDIINLVSDLLFTYITINILTPYYFIFKYYVD